MPQIEDETNAIFETIAAESRKHIQARLRMNF